MKKKYLIYIFLLLFFNFSLAQKEATFWYFGENAGLDFSSGSPIADTNGALNTLEGCTTISDSGGNLLFYTDGTTVWNRRHVTMPTGSPLAGNSSSSQSAIVVPKPFDPDIFYIFTADVFGGTRGLNYYIVDMTLDGGLGDVLGLNNMPFANNLVPGPATEKITAVKVFNENAFWVISLKEDRFYVFKVDLNGVNSNPVMGNRGFTVSDDARGYLKTSPDGTKLVSANMRSGTFIYDFDSSRGTISFERQLDVLEQFGYGVEFSPLSKKLYISTGNFGGGPETEFLFQFNLDIADPTTENLNATRIELHSYVNQRAALQLGLDGKIYRAIDLSNFIGVIDNPEGDGLASNYMHDAISLGDRVSRQGLPPFIQSFFSADIQAENVCFGEITNFTIRSNEPILSIVWDFGDGSPTSTVENPSHLYAAPGVYTVTVEVTTEDETKIVTQEITIFPLPNINTPVTLQQCDDDTDGISNFNLREAESILTSDNPAPTFTYHLLASDADGDTNALENLSTFSNSIASQIFVRVENQFGCYDVATVNLEVSTSAIPANFMVDINECDTDADDNDSTNGITSFNLSSATNAIINLFPSNPNISVAYYESIDDALAEENALDDLNYRNENSPFTQQIVVRVDGQSNACLGLGFHVTLHVDPLPEFQLPEIGSLCSNDLPTPSAILMVQNPEDSYTYEWRDLNGTLLNTSGSTDSIEVFMVGDYFVTATSQDNCIRTKKITVVRSNIATIQQIDVVDDSENNSITVIVTGDGDYEFALDNEFGPYQRENVFENVFAGIHTIFVRDRNGCGIVSQEVSVIGYPRFLTPNGDGFNDTWQVLGANIQPDSKVYIFDRYGKILAKIDPTSQGWDGKYNGKLLPESDYWFLVQLEDGRTRRGHFSLIRR